jgi:hypothetical protein
VAATLLVEAFDIDKDDCLRLLPGLKPSVMNQFGFQSRKEAFHDSIVPTIPWPTHGTLQAVQCESLWYCSAVY